MPYGILISAMRQAEQGRQVPETDADVLYCQLG